MRFIRLVSVLLIAVTGMLLLWAPAATAQTRRTGSAEGIKASDELEAKLTPYVGQVLDLVELGTGGRFVRPTLQGISTRLGEITALAAGA